MFQRHISIRPDRDICPLAIDEPTYLWSRLKRRLPEASTLQYDAFSPHRSLRHHIINHITRPDFAELDSIAVLISYDRILCAPQDVNGIFCSILCNFLSSNVINFCHYFLCDFLRQYGAEIGTPARACLTSQKCNPAGRLTPLCRNRYRRGIWNHMHLMCA